MSVENIILYFKTLPVKSLTGFLSFCQNLNGFPSKNFNLKITLGLNMSNIINYIFVVHIIIKTVFLNVKGLEHFSN